MKIPKGEEVIAYGFASVCFAFSVAILALAYAVLKGG